MNWKVTLVTGGSLLVAGIAGVAIGVGVIVLAGTPDSTGTYRLEGGPAFASALAFLLGLSMLALTPIMLVTIAVVSYALSGRTEDTPGHAGAPAAVARQRTERGGDLPPPNPFERIT